MRAALAKDRHLLDRDEAERIEQGIVALTELLPQDQAALIKDAIARLSALTEDFAARRMNQSIQQALQGRHIDDLAETAQHD